MSYHELPPREGIQYVAAVDPSGGGADAFTLAICHVEGHGDDRRIIQDVMKGWGRVGGQAQDLVGVVREIAAICVRYRIGRVTGDRYAGQWVRQAFREAGLIYDDSVRTRSQAYLEVQPLFATGRIALLDHPVMIRELKCLERRPRAGGQTVVDHPSGGHDDHANALALAAALLVEGVEVGLWFMREDRVVRVPAPELAATLTPVPSIDKMVREEAISTELARQKQEDVQAAVEAEQQAKGLAACAARGENAKRLRAEEAAALAKERALEDADRRRMLRGDGPWWSHWH